jgi:hypothetical protein
MTREPPPTGLAGFFRGRSTLSSTDAGHAAQIEVMAPRRSAAATLSLGILLSIGCGDGAAPGGASPQSGSTAGKGGNGGAPGSSGESSTKVGGTSGVAGTGGIGSGVAGSGSAGVATAGSATAGAAGGSAAGGGGANGGGANGGGGGVGAAGSGGGGTAGSESKSTGCGKTRALQDGNHTLQSGGTERSYIMHAPADYDSKKPYRLILGFHGATGKASDVAPSYFGLRELSASSTIFAAPSAVDGIWDATTDSALVKDLVAQLKDGLCIDTSRIEIEGFSQGGAMVWTLACGLPDTFKLAVVHSGGGLAMPQTCQPIPFFSTLGNDGSGQGMSSDFFAKSNGCMIETMPMPPAGGHVCTDYKGCTTGYPTRWCDYDAGHTPAPTDPGQSKSWVPAEVWKFVTDNG